MTIFLQVYLFTKNMNVTEKMDGDPLSDYVYDFLCLKIRKLKKDCFQYQVFQGLHCTDSNKSLVKSLMYRICLENDFERDIWLTSVIFVERCIFFLRQIDIRTAAIIGLNICVKMFGSKNLSIEKYLNYGIQSLSPNNFRAIGKLLSQQNVITSYHCSAFNEYLYATF